jgi:hypothetical protein
MTGIKVAARIMLFGALFAASELPWAAPVHASPIRTARAACALAKARVAAQRRFPVSRIARCETHRAVDSPRGYYVLALYGWCREDVCGSTNMGWFAVQKATGRLFYWDVGEQKVGPPFAPRS